MEQMESKHSKDIQQINDTFAILKNHISNLNSWKINLKSNFDRQNIDRLNDKNAVKETLDRNDTFNANIRNHVSNLNSWKINMKSNFEKNILDNSKNISVIMDNLKEIKTINENDHRTFKINNDNLSIDIEKVHQNEIQLKTDIQDITSKNK